MISSKKCSKCQEQKSIDCFYKDSSKKDGLRPSCKVCDNAVIQRYRVTDRGQEVAQRALAKYRLSEYYKKRRKDWYNTPAAKAAQKRWRESDSGRRYYRKAQAAFRRTAKGIAHSIHHHAKRRTSLQLVDHTLTSKDIELLFAFFDNKCAYCGSSIDLTIDHIVPVSIGGSHSIDNCLPACRSCNSSKGTRTLFNEWLPKNLQQKEYQAWLQNKS